MVTKRKLKDPNSPVVKRPAPEIALQAKIIELDDYRRAHALAVRAQIEDEQATSSMLKRDPGLAVRKGNWTSKSSGPLPRRNCLQSKPAACNVKAKRLDHPIKEIAHWLCRVVYFDRSSLTANRGHRTARRTTRRSTLIQPSGRGGSCHGHRSR